MTWSPPQNFPNLSTARTIAVDVETRDDDLTKLGPGVRRGGYVVGVAVGTDDGFRGYFPVGHDEGPNLNKSAVFKWLARELARPGHDVVGANLLYDLDYLAQVGATAAGRWFDVINAEALIDENRRGRYDLDSIATHHLGEGKRTDEVAAECKRRGWRGDPRKHLWRLPASVVGPYAEGDVDLPLRVLPIQLKALARDGLETVYDLETRLMPLLLFMRRVGVRVDAPRRNRVEREMRHALDAKIQELSAEAGRPVNYWAAASVAEACDERGLAYGRTPKSDAPSFPKEWLEAHPDPLPRLVAGCRHLDKFLSTFLRGSIGNALVAGRVHASFNQLRSDEYGTVTGRFSSSNPNLQFIPARDPVLGPLCRSMFIPDPGCLWGKADYSQIEFRFFAHYANGAGAEEFRARYREDPNVDYHQQCADMVGIDRRPAKNTNFGLIYGMGVRKLAAQLGMSVGEAKTFLEAYHKKLPFARETMRAVSARADARGWVKTILGRRRRFETWEPADWNLAQSFVATRDRGAVARYVAERIDKARLAKEEPPRMGVRRAKVYRAMNAVIQGSAADLMKKAMVDAWDCGLFEVLTPHITLHDELDCSVPRNEAGREAWDELKRVMESAMSLRVPIVADCELLPNWGGLGKTT